MLTLTNVAFLKLYTDTVQWTCQLFKELHESVNQYLPKDHGTTWQNRSHQVQGEPEDSNVTKDKGFADAGLGHTRQLAFKKLTTCPCHCLAVKENPQRPEKVSKMLLAFPATRLWGWIFFMYFNRNAQQSAAARKKAQRLSGDQTVMSEVHEDAVQRRSLTEHCLSWKTAIFHKKHCLC